MADTLPLTKRRQVVKRHEALKAEREQSWTAHWRELNDYIRPRSGRFLSERPNDGIKVNENIINGTATWSGRVLAAGMMAGVTSPARPWFRLTTPDPELAEHGGVRRWLYVVENRIRHALQRGNVYNALHTVYEGLGDFGTAAMLVEEDAETLVRAYVFPISSYCLGLSPTRRVDTIYRVFSMTVLQLVREFGVDSCSETVRAAYERKELDTWVEVLHGIQPNDGYAYGRAGPPGMTVKSCWLEVNATEEAGTEGFLRESGYEEFPVMAPRWTVTGEDIYGGSCPGMEALGDIKALQVLEKRKGQVVEKIVNPPMKGPTSLMNQRISLLPGDTTFVDSLANGQSFEPAMVVHPQALPAVGAEIAAHEQRIARAYYADLWVSLINQPSTSAKMTAREVAERHEEKMLQLGPVMERLQDELLNPLIDRVFGILLRNGHIPEPPDELQGAALKVDYISLVAQAQKLLHTAAVERLASFVGNLSQVKPDVLDKVDFDQAVDIYADALGAPPDLTRDDEQVAAIRAERAKKQAVMEQAAMATQAAESAKTLSETDTSGDNALNRVLQHLGGPTPGVPSQ